MSHRYSARLFILPLIVLFVAAPSVFAQPINDDIVTSRPLFNAPLTSNGTNVGATAEEGTNPSASCTFGNPDNDGDNSVWWWFAPSSEGSVTIDTNGSGFDTIVTLIRYDFSDYTEVGCNDDDPNNGSGDFTSRIEDVAVSPGSLYYVRVTGYNGDEGDIVLSFEGPVTSPAEDGVAIIMPRSDVYPMTTIGATPGQIPGGPAGPEPPASCTDLDGLNSSWRFFAGTGGPVTLDFESAGFDTVLTLFRDGQEVACDDDGGEGTLSMIANFQTEQGASYLVRVTGYDGAEGNFRLRYQGTPPTANEDTTLPEVVALDAAYPNPFASRTTLPYFLPEAQQVRVVAYDVLGREVTVLAEGVRTAGQHEAIFDVAGLPSGLYVIRLTAGETSLTRRVTVVR